MALSILAEAGITSQQIKNPPDVIEGIKVWFYLNAGNFSSLDARCTNVQTLWRVVNHCMHGLDVWIETTLGTSV